MAKTEGRRTWIKNAAIIFLVILLLLTFFSNTILNYSLPEVSAQYPQYSTLNTSVKLSGTVKANASYNVIFEEDQADAGIYQSRRVISVFVKEGYNIEKDQPIMELKGGASIQLEDKQKEYNELKKQYELSLLDDNVNSLQTSRTLSEAERALNDARNDLNDLYKMLEAVKTGDNTAAVLEQTIERLEEEQAELDDTISLVSSQIAETENKIASAKAVIEDDIFTDLSLSDRLALAESDYRDAEDRYSRCQKAYQDAENELYYLRDAQSSVSEATELSASIESMENQIASLEREVFRYLEDSWTIMHDPGDTDELYSPNADVRDLINDELDSLGYDMASASEETVSYKRRLEDYRLQMDDLDYAVREMKAKLMIIGMPEIGGLTDYALSHRLSDAQEAFDTAAANLTDAESAYNETKNRVENLRRQNQSDGLISQLQAELDGFKAQLDYLNNSKKDKNKQLSALQKELSQTGSVRTEEEIAEEIRQKQNSIASLESDLAITRANLERNNKGTSIDRNEQREQLQKLEEEIRDYQNAPETTVITAPVSGRVVSVYFVPGDTVSSGNAVASIEIADKGYVCEISLPSEEARKVQVGAPCSITNSWWYSNVEASISQIRSDPQSQGKNRIIVIDVKGDVSEGQELKFSVGDRSQSYECVLPNSAIREDNDGKYVLTVQSKKTPLGVRYTAKRTPIDIVASDDTQSAVSGLYGSEFVITNATSPISDRQQVRLAEN